MKNYLSQISFLKISRNNSQIFMLPALLIFGLFLRTHFGTDYYTFGDEAIRDASIGFIGAKEFQFPLTGPFSSLGPFTFGPWYYYQLIFSYLFIPSFWAPWISLTLFSLLFIIVVYKIGLLIQDKYLGLIAALLATISIAQLDAARVLTNPSSVGFLSAVALLLAVKVYKGTRSWRISVLWGFVTGVAILYHYQAFWLLTLLIFALVPLKKNPKIILHYFVGLLIAALPTLFFELNNHWITSWSIWRYLAYDQYRIYLPNRWLFYIRDFIPNFLGSVLGTPRPLTMVFITLSIFTLGRDLLKHKLKKELFYLLLSAGIVFVALRYYRGERSFGYLQFLHVYIFIFIAYTIRNFFPAYKNAMACFLCLVILASALIWQNKEFKKDHKNQEALSIVSELNRLHPNWKYDWYTCGRFTVEKTQAVTLLLDYGKQLDKNGEKISFSSTDECPLPKGRDISKTGTEEINRLKRIHYPVIRLKNDELTILSFASESGLIHNNWYRVNPKILAESLTKWWYREKP